MSAELNYTVVHKDLSATGRLQKLGVVKAHNKPEAVRVFRANDSVLPTRPIRVIATDQQVLLGAAKESRDKAKWTKRSDRMAKKAAKLPMKKKSKAKPKPTE